MKAHMEEFCKIPLAKVRKQLALLSLITAAAVLYGSLLPLRFEKVSLPESLEAFNQIPWLELGLTKRADWLANGLLLVPLGFFLTGCLNYGRKSLAFAGIKFGIIVLIISVFICFIEWAQVFFPPRVRSLNDMLAGFAGGITGALLWHLTGNFLIDKLNEFTKSPKGLPRILFLIRASIVLLALSSLMPLDIMTSMTELKTKYSEGKIQLIPFADIKSYSQILSACMHAVWVIPASVAWTLSAGEKYAIKQVTLWVCIIETLKLPIYGRYCSLTDIFLTIAMGTIWVSITPSLAPRIKKLDRMQFWGPALFVWIIVIFVVCNHRFMMLTLDPLLLRERFNDFLSVPYASAQRSTEFQALENIAGKAFLFAILGCCCERFTLRIPVQKRLISKKNRQAYGLLFIAIIALGVELTQIALLPLIAELSDVITYTLGGIIGILLTQQTLMDN